MRTERLSDPTVRRRASTGHPVVLADPRSDDDLRAREIAIGDPTAFFENFQAAPPR